jgi:hypothetical protein
MTTAALRLDAPVLAAGQPLETAALLQRYVDTTAVADRLAAELIDRLPGRSRRADNGSLEDVGERATTRRPADEVLSVMLRKGQIEPRLYLAAREVERLLLSIEVARHIGSSVPVMERVDGSTGRSDGEVALLGRVHRWARLQSEITADPGCGPTEDARRAAVRIVEAVARDGRSIADLERAGEYGRRAVVARRLRSGLIVCARHFGIRPDARASVRVMPVDSSDAMGDGVGCGGSDSGANEAA